MVNFGPLAAEIGLPVWGTPANFNGSLLADRAEARPAHHSADPEPPMLVSFHCKHSGVRSSWNGATAQTDAQTGAGQIVYRRR